MRVRIWKSISFLACVALTVHPAAAVVFCAHNTADIQAALTAAQANGDDDQIEITTGNIGASALTFSSSEGHSIELYGGYEGLDCENSAPLDATTTLNGQNTVRILYIHNPGGPVAVSRLTFSGGKAPPGGYGGAVYIDGSGLVLMAGDTFVGNKTTGAGGAVVITAVFVEFVNNLLFGNHGGQVGGAFFNISGPNNVIANNTIVANISDDASSPAGVSAVGAGTYTVGNNIIRDNAAPGGSDFGIFSTNTRKTNDIGIVKASSTPGSVSGELSVDPQFVPCSGILCFNFELDSSSPLVDGGSDIGMPFVQTRDVAGKPRKLGPRIDIGAYENADLIFADHF